MGMSGHTLGAVVIVALLAATGCGGGSSGLGNEDLAAELSAVVDGAEVTCEDREGEASGAPFDRVCTFTREERTFESFGEKARTDGTQSRVGGYTTTMKDVELRIQVVDQTWCEATTELPRRYRCS
jgi:hypothetical protein